MGHTHGELAGLGEIQDQRGRGDGGAAQTVQGTYQSADLNQQLVVKAQCLKGKLMVYITSISIMIL